MANKTTEFANRLLELMIDENGKQKVSQGELAAAVGVTRQAISKYMNSATLPDCQTLAGIAKYFHVSSDYLLGLSNTKSVDPNLKIICEFTGLSENAAETLRDSSHGQKYENFLQRLIDDLCTTEITDEVSLLELIADDVYNAAKVRAGKVKAENKKWLDIRGITNRGITDNDIADYLITRAQTLLADISKNALERIEEETIDWLLSNEEEGTEPRLVRLTLQEEDMDDG